MRRAAIAMFAALMAAPGPALAATLTLDAGVATYTGGSTAERVEVRYDATAGTVAFAEPLGAVTPPPAGCSTAATATETVVACPATAIAALVVRTGDGPDELLVSTVGGSPAVTLQAALGPGDDRLTATGANWPLRVEGGDGRDTLTGGGLADLLAGGAGADVLDGGGGPDVLRGAAGDDRVSYRARIASVHVTIGDGANDGEAGEADDVEADVEGVLGGAGDDVLVGTRRADALDGGGGNDVLRGLAGRDALLGDGPTDPATGAAVDPAMLGDDVLEGGRGADLLDGGGGIDTVSYAERLKRVRVDLRSAAAIQGEAGERDTIRGVENVWGGMGRDTLIGDANPNVLHAGPGRDVVNGGGGADVLVGGPGRDTLRGEGGDDAIAAREGARDVIVCGPGRDTVALDDDDLDRPRRDCERRDVFAGGGVGGAPLGSPANPEDVLDPSRPYALVAVTRLAPAADGTLPVRLVCSARAGARCTGTIVLRHAGRVVGRADVVAAAGRDATIPVPLDAGLLTRAQSRALRVNAVVEVRDVLLREARTRAVLVVRAARIPA